MTSHYSDIHSLAAEFESCQKILKDAGILKMRREGTKNYYYFDADMEAMNRLIHMLNHAKIVMEQLPDRSGDN